LQHTVTESIFDEVSWSTAACETRVVVKRYETRGHTVWRNAHVAEADRTRQSPWTDLLQVELDVSVKVHALAT
jgi:hypothetical protein